MSESAPRGLMARRAADWLIAIGLLGAAGIVGWAALWDTEPPESFDRPLAGGTMSAYPEIGLAIEGVRVTPGRGLEGIASIIDADAPPLVGSCPGSARVLVILRMSEPFWRDHRNRLLRQPRPRFALVVPDPSASGFKPDDALPPLTVVSDERGTIASGRDPVGRYAWNTENDLVLTFSVPWVARRGIGSCWFALPALTTEKPFAVPQDAEWAAQNAITSGTSLVGGYLTSPSDSRPPPTLLGGGWTCQRGRTTRSLLENCSAVAAVNARSREAFINIALIVCGLFLSAGVAALARAGRRESRANRENAR